MAFMFESRMSRNNPLVYSPPGRKEFPPTEMPQTVNVAVSILPKSQYPVLRQSRCYGSPRKCPFPGLHPMRNCVADSTAACLEEPQAMPSALLLNSWTSMRL